MLVLLHRYRTNRWLWLTALFTGWHAVEHGYILSMYLRTGLAGTPGLLAQGGALGGGLPLTRPDLHFEYNLIETIPLIGAFLQQAHRAARPAGTVTRTIQSPGSLLSS